MFDWLRRRVRRIEVFGIGVEFRDPAAVQPLPERAAATPRDLDPTRPLPALVSVGSAERGAVEEARDNRSADCIRN